MKTLTAVAIGLAVFAAPALGAKPPKPPKPAPAPAPAPAPPAGGKVQISAVPNPVLFGRSVVLSAKNGNRKFVATAVLSLPAPFVGNFARVATGVSDAKGDFSATLKPLVNTKYRVLYALSPGPYTIPGVESSGDLLVFVAFRPTLRLSDSTPRRGQRVRFSGSVAPARNGRTVYLQRKRRNGSYGTVARTKLRKASATRSVYSIRRRVRSSGTFRTYIKGDVSNSTGKSRSRSLRVH